MILNGSKVNRFSRILGHDLSQTEVDNITTNAIRLIEKVGSISDPSCHGLLFGQIQSGKTNNMLMSTALASDNGFRLFIILTSDNVWLYDQTLDRINKSLPGMQALGKDQWMMAHPERIQTALQTGGLVLMATKNTHILQSLIDFIEMHCPDDIRPIIFDDEADQASLNTLLNNETDDLSGVNEAIVSIRSYFESHVYVQVTATPQSLFLQHSESDFAPQFTVTFEPGEDYIGGDSFFEAEQHLSPMRLFPDNEIDDILSSNNLDVEESWEVVPTGLRRALCSFFVAAASKLIHGEGNAFSCVCHVSQRQDPHKRIERLVNSFVTRLTRAMANSSSADSTLVIEYLRDAFDDMKLTNPNAPSFQDVVQEIAECINSTSIQLLISGSKIASYSSPFNILIGGNRLGRGVTIKRLLVTYYGRTSKTPQVDTILQHSRMYGYRKKDMNVMRFYVSSSLLEIFKGVHESNKQLWTMARKMNPAEMQAIVLSRTTHSLLRATRTSVVYVDALAFYMPGVRYFPYSPFIKNVDALDKILMPFIGSRQLMQVPIDMLIQIVNLTASDEAGGGSWDDEAIKTCLRNMKGLFQNRGFLEVRETDTKRGFRSIIAGSSDRFDPSAPTLTMYRFEGSIDKGWEGKPFWVPNLRFPDGNRFFMFTVL
ncbi:Z1 domain-containing protein [Paenibacillus sp. GP183]|uniref:Z1 domain-containing protein n=1 Tax=Paenibacillus sp. GP183 TaxID=1882751 RepID=UPI00089B9669|nr:Z1 domain-containing protein [Paenibacillus sp. GP183]SED07063.1 Z1 domain-containing protein [Paenibacillus sp. GP183]